MNTHLIRCLSAIIAVMAAPLVHAQYDASAGNFNWIYAPYTTGGVAASPFGPPTQQGTANNQINNQASFPQTANSNFQGVGQVAGSTSAKSVATVPGTYVYSTTYPSNAAGANAASVVLENSFFGGVFASGVPRYLMGDVMTSPLVTVDGTTQAPANYWRQKPVEPGEIVNGGTPVTAYSVNVTASDTTSSEVTVESITSGVVVGASMLGQPITAITGRIVTLAGNANLSISSSLSVVVTPAMSYYYSPHAERVYASQPGRVQITWVTLIATGGVYGTLTETFSVSSNTTVKPRRIYWTENGFDGPRVSVADGRITTVNPIYNSSVPKAVANEVNIPGASSLTPNLKTLFFDKFGGIGQIKAYNVEGRILVEYLGNVRLGTSIYDSIGVDVVDIVRAPDVNYATVNLGLAILPHDGDTSLDASPVTSTAVSGYYATSVQNDGTSNYFAEKTTGEANSPDDGNPSSGGAAYNSVVFYWMETGNFSMKWPKYQDRYWLRWSPNLSDYTHNTVAAGGSSPATGIQFEGGALPAIVYQDDPAQAQAKVDVASQRLYVTLQAGDQRNRALLKFTNSGASWYVNLYTQAEDRIGSLRSHSNNSDATVTVPSTIDLEVGMVVTGPGISGTATIISITDTSSYVLSQVIGFATNDLKYTVEEDGNALIDGTALVGTRLVAPAGHENAGFISGGTNFYPAGYLDPTLVGVALANAGSIIPVNALPGNHTLTVRWYKKTPAPNANFKDLYVPGKIGRYTVVYPSSPSQIVIAQGVGTNDLPDAEAAGSVYVQNDKTQPGYNPNEEHAFMLGGRAYALREDLNIYTNSSSTYPASGYTAATYTSEPYVLIAYTDMSDKRPSMHAYQVLRSNASYSFDYTATAGTWLVKPYPLPLMPLAMTGTGKARKEKSVEVLTAVDIPSNTSYQADEAYNRFTFQDRKGFTWVHRGPHSNPKSVTSTSNGSSTLSVTSTSGLVVGMAVSGPGITGSASIVSINSSAKTLVLSQTVAAATAALAYSPALTMRLYYLSQPGFFIPGLSLAAQPAAGTPLPFLRAAARSGMPLNTSSTDCYATTTLGTDQIDAPLAITYHAAWPTNAPQLRVAETLTLPKFGLPQVRGQKSAQVFYQQSIAGDPSNGTLKTSVTLHDPTREKIVALDAAGVGLLALPASIKTTSYQGKTYFQTLPPSLQQRIYLDPTRGAKGSLVFIGQFHEQVIGDNYLDLNLFTTDEENKVKGLVPTGSAGKSSWDAAIVALKTQLQTFKSDDAKFGSYMVDPSKNVTVDDKSLAVIKSAETAVDSYAITATGQGSGYVTMVFGNGKAFTPVGDPVSVQVFKIANQLYPGDLKVITSSNPLDEQVTLRHSGDFAGKPEDYEFDWRWSTGEASAPATYSSVMTKRIGDAATSSQNWQIVSDPGALTASAAQYTAAGAALPLPRQLNVHPVNYLMDAQNQPISVMDETSYTDAEVAAGYPALMLKSASGVDFSGGVPARIVFSATLGAYDGCVLYVNGKVALAFNAPDPQFTSIGASSGLTINGLNKQFSVDPSYFAAGANTIEVAAYSGDDPNTMLMIDFMLEAAQETDLVTRSGTAWQSPSDPNGLLSNTAIIGGSPTNPFGGPQFVLNDRWFTMRYRPKASANNVLGVPWSRWVAPQFTEGWVKRVLAAINPFTQRIKDLSNTAVNTDVSMLTQAGSRWEGDLALNMDNINSAGLIAIYETVLNRAKSMSLDANVNDPDTNSALLLAAGYLNDLYTILGNEAFADAANPTISLDNGAVNTSRFSFEGQVASSLEEEMALLRGRDDLLSPGVNLAPAYNRLYWNYTHGINSGEAIYAVNYNIKEKLGSPTSNGVLDASDAQRMFPQGHGDAYGHYLTALTGYYRLLWNENFTWTPSAEAVTVLGVPVTVDFQDERKFAASANNLAKTAEQICALTFRQSYKDDPASGWTQFRDHTPTNTQTQVTRHWGLDETISRSAQGALVNWAMANAILPDVDNYHTGIQKIDRTTVPELGALVATAQSFQSTLDNAYAHLNPLGLSPGAVPFDIDPYFASSLGQELSRYQGMSQFAQYYERALASLNNAAGAFNQAATMTGSLRDQTNSVDDYSADIATQETAYVNQLIDIYGRPYSGDIGAGKLYAQGYSGPDLTHWFIVDRPNDLVNTLKTVSFTLKEANQIKEFTGNSITDVVNGYNSGSSVTSHTVNIAPSQWVQYNDVWQTGGLGSRVETGELQNALQDAQQSWLAISAANVDFQKCLAEMRHKGSVFEDLLASHRKTLAETIAMNVAIAALSEVELYFATTKELAAAAAETESEAAKAVATAVPGVEGLAVDALAPVRGAVAIEGTIMSSITKVASVLSGASEGQARIAAQTLEQNLTLSVETAGFTHEEVQLASEYDTAYRDVTTQANTIMQLTISHQSALQNVNNVVAKGLRILAEREVFRQRAASIIQGYRTKDMTFRTFRNEALEQYRSLYDLASRYTYLAAKAYDYETGLLGSSQGQTVFSKIVASRSLGDLNGGVPQSTVSTLGDAGLAGTMAQLRADFSVAESRLGINNPDYYGTVFSLRQELFRIQDDPTITSDDDAWKQTLEQHIVSNVLNDADVASACRNIKKPDGSAVPGIIISFSTTIESGKNFFGQDLCGGDHIYSPSSYATIISNAGIVLPGYVGMDASIGGPPVDSSNSASVLSATPYVYLIPCGNDCMRAPPLGDKDIFRTWKVQDQAMPLPYNLGASDFNSTQFFDANGTLSSQPWIIRKHQSFRAVADKELFDGGPPLEYSCNRLIGRSAWNTRWKIVIPAVNLLKDEQAALSRFVGSVTDVQLYLRTYSHSGN